MYILKNKIIFFTAYQENGKDVKRIRKSIREDLDEALLKWVKQKQSLNVLLNGPILMVKGELAKLMKE